MLQSIHDKFKGWLAGLVLGAIALVFIFWGINWTMSAPTYAAKVNGSEISANEVRQSYQRQLAQFERQGSGPIDEAQRNFIKQRVLDQFVNSEAIVTRTDALGYRVSDAEVIAAMSKIPALQEDGKFDLTHAIAILRGQGRSIGEIEDLIRHDVKLQQLDTALAVSSFVTPAEMKQLETLTRQQRETAWVTLPAAKYAADSTPDDAAVKGYYDAHKAEYMTPETVNLRYVEISLASIEATLKVDDAQLKAFYDGEKAKSPERFVQPEQRRVRHILLAVPDAKDDAAVKAKADGILKRVQAGEEDFSKLATEFSQDPGSASQGGDLGWSDRKAWVAPFADAAYSLKVGDISRLVKTQFGYHILKLDGIQPSSEKTFEQAKPDLETEYRRSEAERLVNTAQDQLADAALQSSADIDVAARKAGLAVKEIPNFSRMEGGGDLNSRAVIDAAFSSDVLEGHLSSLVEVDKGRGVVLQASDHKLPQQKPLEAVRAEVVLAWKKRRGAQLAQAAAQAAIKRLDAGESWDTVVKSLSGTVVPSKFISRTDEDVPLDVRKAVFEAPKPAPKPVYAQVPLADGDAVVFAVSAVRLDPSAEAPPAEATLRQQFARQVASTEAQAYAMAARASAKVSLNPQVLE